MKKISLIILGLLGSCSSENKYKEYNFGEFTLTGPKTWSIVNVKGIDSYVKEIITKNHDTLYFDYGFYSNPLEEPIHPIYDESLIKVLVKEGFEENKLRFANEKAYEEALNKRRDIYEFAIIDGFKAKIVKPKKIGEGITGVYFDSLATNDIMNVKLNFLGVDLNVEDHKEVLEAIKTIKFKK